MNPTRRQLIAAFAAAPTLPLLRSKTAQETGLKEAPAKGAASRKIPKLQATVILVRHTEKDTNDRRNPDLSKAGVERAREFARMFGAAGVTHLLHSEYKRTRDTLAPLAKATDVTSEVIPAADHDALIKRLSEAGPDDVIAIAGHSNTVPHVAWTFGINLPDLDTSVIGDFGYLPHGAYDRVHVLTPGPKAVRLTELRYGKPSPSEAPKK